MRPGVAQAGTDDFAATFTSGESAALAALAAHKITNDDVTSQATDFNIGTIPNFGPGRLQSGTRGTRPRTQAHVQSVTVLIVGWLRFR